MLSKRVHFHLCFKHAVELNPERRLIRELTAETRAKIPPLWGLEITRLDRFSRDEKRKECSTIFISFSTSALLDNYISAGRSIASYNQSGTPPSECEIKIPICLFAAITRPPLTQSWGSTFDVRKAAECAAILMGRKYTAEYDCADVRPQRQQSAGRCHPPNCTGDCFQLYTHQRY